MTTIDWIVLAGTLLFIVTYGVVKTSGSKNINSYLLGDKDLKWWTIGLSVMATQASAITFLSTPGQAFDDGMRFVQFYFGLPIAMVVLSVIAIPIYYRLKVFTAYEYLESRFDVKTRTLASLFFLIQRGLGAGITIMAPSIILSAVLGWNIIYSNLIIGILVITYTVSGGTKAVSQTQKQQMIVMMGGMVLAGIFVINLLPDSISFGKAVGIAGKLGKMNLITTDFDPTDRYNIWSGIIGGFFLHLGYFGTDQSQVSRYLSGRSITESRLGLLFNALFKVPMQFIILFIGVMVFVFYLFVQPPAYFNSADTDKLRQSELASDLEGLESEHASIFEARRQKIFEMSEAMDTGDESKTTALQDEIKGLETRSREIKGEIAGMVKEVDPYAAETDRDYVFITFVMEHLPHGLIGLLLAVIFSAAMSSTSSELNALASTSTVDIYRRSIKKKASDKHYLNASKLSTLLWGILAIIFATVATKAENLIQFVNIVGSLFYGTVLGVFLTAFFFKYVKGNAVFIAALITQAIIFYLFYTDALAFLWFNLVGPVLVIFIGFTSQFLINRTR